MCFMECVSEPDPLTCPFPAPINTAPCPRNPALTNPDYRDFDPRLSLAWAPAAMKDKTVIRADFGIYHGAAQNDDENAGLESDTYRVTVNGRANERRLRAGKSGSLGPDTVEASGSSPRFAA